MNKPTKMMSRTIHSAQHCTRFCAIHHCATRLKPVSAARSEEHTSELQSLMRRSYAVLCFKKKKRPQTNTPHHQRSQNQTIRESNSKKHDTYNKKEDKHT